MKNTRALENIKKEYTKNLNEKSIWYAVLIDSEDNDYGTGSFDFIDACELLDRLNGESIAIVDDNDGFCLDIINRDELEEFM